MKNITELMSSLSIPMVTLLCLVVGYILKHWIKDVKNRLIPTILVVLGAVAACFINETISIENIVAGSISALASTGLHQTFKQLIKGDKNGDN